MNPCNKLLVTNTVLFLRGRGVENCLTTERTNSRVYPLSGRHLQIQNNPWGLRHRQVQKLDYHRKVRRQSRNGTKEEVSFRLQAVVYKTEHLGIKQGAGIAQWLEHRTRDWKVAGSNPCWNGGRIFFSRVDFLCWLLFRYPFHPRVTTVARKISRSFCQKVQVAGYS